MIPCTTMDLCPLRNARYCVHSFKSGPGSHGRGKRIRITRYTKHASCITLLLPSIALFSRRVWYLLYKLGRKYGVECLTLSRKDDISFIEETQVLRSVNCPLNIRLRNCAAIRTANFAPDPSFHRT